MSEKMREEFERIIGRNYPDKGEFRSDFEIGFGSGWQACAAHYERKLAEAQARERKLREEIDIIANNLGEFECAMQTQKLADDLSGHVSQLFVLLALPSDSTELDRLLAEARHELREQNAELQRQLDEAAKQGPIFFGDDEMIAEWRKGSRRGGAVDIRIISTSAGMCTTPLYALPPNLPALIEQAKREEREECAKLCEEIVTFPAGHNGQFEGYGPIKTTRDGKGCAAAIRARSGK